ncbi:unnamed protein product [Cladocopium goreaui]|uniref:Palmitoyl-monogalactosyldiacylglycerol delta-7 desaturase, chloroplastic n=1 Tax=Cladocopium goreaui TaxID=2562237 RepID=A0A9P1CKR7_9DINO|nr:unnamed protein product [Cladocopium goreaui]
MMVSLSFWVVVKETGKRTEESSYEHQRSKRQKVDDDSDPTSDLGTNFAGLDAATKRQTDKDKGNFDQPGMTKYMQDRWTTKEALKRVLSSMISKSGKLRSLARELKKNYAESATAECLKNLELQIKNVDSQYDLCNEAWAKGEVEDFQGEEFLE